MKKASENDLHATCNYLSLLWQQVGCQSLPVMSLLFKIASVGFCSSLQGEMLLHDGLRMENFHLNFVVCYEAVIFQYADFNG